MPKLLDALAITTAVTAQASAALPLGTGAPDSLVVITDFVYGSGGTSGKVWVQTSIDGSTWTDIANMTFTTASKKRLHNVTACTIITTPYAPLDGTLADDTVRDGIVGAPYRTKLTTLGTYAATSLTVTVIPQP